MFDIIDFKLIDWFQYWLRQIELYTPIERKDLIDFFIRVFRLVLILWAVISVTMSVFISPTIFIFGAVGIFTNYPYFLSCKEIANKEPSKDMLPEEIISRYTFRMAYGLTSMSSILFLPSLYLICISEIGDIFIFILFVMISFSSLCLYVLFFLEYLFCTTSLPPGEKQKMTEEKESGKMSPVMLFR